ncbi:TPA: hypothetical protein ACGEYN_000604 [Raoultella ornithinolytica]
MNRGTLIMNRNIHFVGDGLGPRKVFVNGNQIDGVFFADIQLGIVRYHPRPFRAHKRRKGELYERTLKGRVEVVPCGEVQ